MIVKDFMTTEVTTCDGEHTVQDAANLMSEKGFSILPIVDEENHLLGIVTESDFVGKEIEIPHAMASLKMLFGKVYHMEDIENVYKSAKDTKLKNIMSSKVKTISKESSLSSVIDTMVNNHLKRLPVVEGGKLIGIITRKDLLRSFKQLNND